MSILGHQSTIKSSDLSLDERNPQQEENVILVHDRRTDSESDSEQPTDNSQPTHRLEEEANVAHEPKRKKQKKGKDKQHSSAKATKHKGSTPSPAMSLDD
ncbi:hypothetical protein N7528_006566 [Penicillium herquei]|nr:hypothetical protein N7528_006566 [Penicillium herquei]